VTDKDLDMFVRSRKDVFTGEGARLDLASGSGKFGRPGECVCPRVLDQTFASSLSIFVRSYGGRLHRNGCQARFWRLFGKCVMT